MSKQIRMILAVVSAMVLMVSLGAGSAEETQIHTARFAACDMNVNYVYYNATEADAEAVFGEPASSETIVSEATGESSEYWYYENMTLVFGNGGMLTGAEVQSGAYTGPRGLQVGMTADEAAALFYVDPASADGSFYSAGYLDTFGFYIPPSGAKYEYDDGTFMYAYFVPEQPYSEELLSDPINCVYEVTAQLYIQFGADETVTGFSWYMSAMAE